MSQTGYLGIDAGTQGLSIVLCDASLKVIATGEGDYEMVAGLDDGCYEQNPNDWIAAMSLAMADLRAKVADEFEVLAIGISGQMHGEVLVGEDGDCLKAARLWCDARNEAEGDELTDLLGVKMPKRITAARWLWTLRNQPEIAAKAKRITTPAGWIAYRLTGDFNLGIGDAAGMFPIDQDTCDFDSKLLQKFERFGDSAVKLGSLLPKVRVAGESGWRADRAGC